MLFKLQWTAKDRDKLIILTNKMLLLFITFFLGVRNIWQQKYRNFRLTAKIIKIK